MTYTKPLNIIDYIDYDSYTKALEKAFEDMINNEIGGTLYTLPHKGNSTFTYTLPSKYPDKRFIFIYSTQDIALYHKKRYINTYGKPDCYPQFLSISDNATLTHANIAIIEHPTFIKNEREYLSYLLTNILTRADMFINLKELNI